MQLCKHFTNFPISTVIKHIIMVFLIIVSTHESVETFDEDSISEDEKEKAVVVIQQFIRRYLAKRRLQKDAEVHILFIVIIHVHM